MEQYQEEFNKFINEEESLQITITIPKNVIEILKGIGISKPENIKTIVEEFIDPFYEYNDSFSYWLEDNEDWIEDLQRDEHEGEDMFDDGDLDPAGGSGLSSHV